MITIDIRYIILYSGRCQCPTKTTLLWRDRTFIAILRINTCSLHVNILSPAKAAVTDPTDAKGGLRIRYLRTRFTIVLYPCVYEPSTHLCASANTIVSVKRKLFADNFRLLSLYYTNCRNLIAGIVWQPKWRTIILPKYSWILYFPYKTTVFKLQLDTV